MTPDPRLLRLQEDRQLAETFPAGDFVREEMEARGWSIEEMARQAVIPVSEVTAILNGGRVGLVLSQRLGIAFGCAAELFARLDMIHRRKQKKGKS
jgi:HTH-type transcriptional regulator/antitoxin HigA